MWEHLSFCCTGCLSRQEGTCLLLAGLGACQRNRISPTLEGPKWVAVSRFPWNRKCQQGPCRLSWGHFSKAWLDTSASCCNLGSFPTDRDFDLKRGRHLLITLSTTHGALGVELKIRVCPQGFPVCCWRALCLESFSAVQSGFPVATSCTVPGRGPALPGWVLFF